jgi:hypothetical protein
LYLYASDGANAVAGWAPGAMNNVGDFAGDAGQWAGGAMDTAGGWAGDGRGLSLAHTRPRVYASSQLL